MLNPRTVLLVSTSLLLTGCLERSERICEGFNHPLAEVWTENNGLGEMRSFADTGGSLKNYTLQSIDKSAPGGAASAIRDSCIESAEYLYVDTSADIAFTFDFTQFNVRVGQPIDEQIVELEVNTQNPVGVDIDSGRLIVFDLDDLTRNNRPGSDDGTTGPRETEYIPEATVNGEIYIDLLQHTFIDNSTRFTDDSVAEQARWVRVLLAKDIGLLQYELLNGEVYTLTRN